jgi:hypothetical protein
VALNCVANGKVLRDGAFENVWIQPAAGDAGGALGAALAAVHLHKGQPRTATNGGDGMQGAYLGPSLSQDEIERGCRGRRALERAGRRRLIERDGRRARRRQGGRLVPGPHGVRPARARRALDPRRPALADDAEDAQPQGQVPRELPALRALGAARGRRRLVRARRRQPLHAAGRRRGRATAAAP